MTCTILVGWVAYRVGLSWRAEIILARLIRYWVGLRRIVYRDGMDCTGDADYPIGLEYPAGSESPSGLGYPSRSDYPQRAALSNGGKFGAIWAG